jgi:C-terminal processing protease CtpA/Prc
MRDGDIAWMRERFEAAERERERLRSAAEAEDRSLTREERLRLWQFETQLEQEIGNENYDRLLYAAGEYNRVLVRVVAPNSFAEAAGLKRGDIIVRYDGIPVFKFGHVVDLLHSTENGASVPIEVTRAGEIFELTLNIGPTHRPPVGRIFGLSVTRHREAP